MTWQYKETKLVYNTNLGWVQFKITFRATLGSIFLHNDLLKYFAINTHKAFSTRYA